MALRPDRHLVVSECTHQIDVVASKGQFLVFSVAGSGSSLGTSAGVVTLVANPSGKIPAGMLLQDVVNLDLTRFHENWNKEEININDFCDVARVGWFVTDQIIGTPTEGTPGYLSSSGMINTTMDANGGVIATPYVGRFGSSKDESGFAKFEINMPNVNVKPLS